MMILNRHALVCLCWVALTLGAGGIRPAEARTEAAVPPERVRNPAPPAPAVPTADPPAAAIAATLTQNFDAPETPRVGDRLTLTLTIQHPVDTRVHLPDALPNPRWEVSNTQVDTTRTEGAQTTRAALTFQIFRPGESTLPGFKVTVLGSDGQPHELRTEAVSAKIVPVLPADKTPELNPARPPVAVWTQDYTLLWVGGGLGAMALVGGLVFLLARRRRPEDPGPPPPPAHVVALEKLSALASGALLDAGEYMLFYVRMSEAVREYLGRRYGFPGTELTTTEILAQLNKVEGGEGWPKGIDFADVRDWLNDCDLIKFSDLVPARERSDRALRQAFSIVELTRHQPSADTPAPESAPEAASASTEQNNDESLKDDQKEKQIAENTIQNVENHADSLPEPAAVIRDEEVEDSEPSGENQDENLDENQDETASDESGETADAPANPEVPE